MPDARLEVTDALGRRIVPIAKEMFGIGRRETNDLRLAGSEVSRDHAEIVAGGGGFLVRDKQSRYGTFVNDEPVSRAARSRTAIASVSGDPAAPSWSSCSPTPRPAQDKATTTAIGDLRQIAALLDGLRALGSGRVLDDVLALVLDSAIEVTGAERGFIMLASAEQRARVQAGARPPPADAARHELRDQPQDSRGSVPHRRAEDPRRPARRRARQRPHGHRRARHPQRAVRAAEARALRRSAGRRRRRRAPHRRALSRQPREGLVPLGLDARRARDAGDRSGRRDRERAALSRDDGEGEDGAGDADRGRDPAGAPAQGRPLGRVLPHRPPRRSRAGRSAATSSTTWICRTAPSASRSATSPARARPRRSSAR